MSILGNTVVRKEDPKLLTVGGRYVGDLHLNETYYATFVTSTVAHGSIVALDLEAARSAEGVIGVYSAEDLSLVSPRSVFSEHPTMVQPYLASETVRFVGEPVVMIVATSPACALDAAELVFIDYEARPAVTDLEAAYRNEVLLFPEEGTNVVTSLGQPFDDAFFDDAEIVVSQRMVNQRLAPAPLEGRALAAVPGEDGRLTCYASTQTPHSVKSAVVEALGIAEDMVRVITPDVGGGFGAKASQYREEILVAWAAHSLGSPVTWVETRSQNMVGLGHGRAQVQVGTIGATAEGRITGYRLDVLQDGGAYPMVGCFLPILTMQMAPGIYNIPKLEFRSSSVVTNTTPIVSYRGAGRPEATAAIECLMDLLARKLQMDPAELRRMNMIEEDAFPFTTTGGSTYDVGAYGAALDKALAVGRYGALREEQRERRQQRSVRQLGIGLSCYVEVTNPFPSQEFGGVEVLLDGSVLVRSGTSPHGQGHDTSWSMLVSEVLGVPLEKVVVVTGDTDRVPRGVGTFGSRSLQLGGVAVFGAAQEVLELARQVGSELLEADPEDLVISDDGLGLQVVGSPTSQLSWSTLAQAAMSKGTPLSSEVDFKAENSTFPFGAHLIVVEVDVETGKVEIRSVVAVDDAGKIVAPLLAEGQVHGGLAQGIAQALMEEVVYDGDGNPLTSNLADYAMISAAELPSFQLVHQETPTFLNPLGAKGIGESGTIGSTPAVVNAVLDALSPYGIEYLDMPLTPNRIWKALSSQGETVA